jgi:hypothetical protein
VTEWNCEIGCKFSDAWRCAKDQRYFRIACQCECHRYIDRQVREAKQSAETRKQEQP